MKEVLNIIIGKYSDNHLITSALSKFSENYNENDATSLEALVRIAYIFYLTNDINSAKLICSEISNISFKGNFNYWTWIEMAIVLLMRINREGNTEPTNKLKDVVLAVLNAGNDLQNKVNTNNFNRVMAGQTLDFSKIQSAIIERDRPSELDYRLTYFMKLVKIREMGASENFSIAEADSQIEENKLEITTILKEIDLSKVLPFSEIE